MAVAAVVVEAAVAAAMNESGCVFRTSVSDGGELGTKRNLVFRRLGDWRGGEGKRSRRGTNSIDPCRQCSRRRRQIARSSRRCNNYISILDP